MFDIFVFNPWFSALLASIVVLGWSYDVVSQPGQGIVEYVELSPDHAKPEIVYLPPQTKARRISCFGNVPR